MHHVTQEVPPPRLLNLAEVLKRVSLSRCTVYRLMSTGDFPKSIPITQFRVAWLESDISAWVLRKANHRELN
jgi:prophage regulatory protein